MAQRPGRESPYQSIKLGVKFDRNRKTYYNGQHEHREAVLVRRNRGYHLSDQRIQDYQFLELHDNVCRFYGKELFDDIETVPNAVGKQQVIAFETSKTQLQELAGGEIIDAMMGVAKGLMHIHRVGHVVDDFGIHSIILVGKNFKLDLKPTVKISLEECQPRSDNREISPEDNIVELGEIFASLVTGFRENWADLLAGDPNHLYLCQHRREALNLIALLQERKIKTAETVVQHPLFWDSQMRLQFLADVKHFLGDQDLRIAINNLKPQIFDGHWLELQKLGKSVYLDYQNDVAAYNKKYEDTVSDLLRAIRNKDKHIQEAGYQAKEVFLSYDSSDVNRGFDLFMESKFPNLFILVYEVISKSKFGRMTTFRKYSLRY